MTTNRILASAAFLALGASLAASAPLLAETPAPSGATGGTEYTVQKGDTLWDISGKTQYDPFRWPVLWDGNREIENPHLLLPGQRLLIPGLQGIPASPAAPAAPGPGAAGETPAPAVEEPPAFPPAPAQATAEPAVRQGERKAGPRFLPLAEKQDLIAVLATYGFITDAAETGLGRVRSVASGHRLLYPGDQAEIALPPGSGVQAGKTYSLARTVREIRHPLSDVRVGDLVRVLGEVTVSSVAPSAEGGEARGEVTALFGPAEVGDALMERVDYLSWIPRESREVAPTVTGTVIATPDGALIAGRGDVVFIDLGTGEGIGPGDRLSVWDDRPLEGEHARALEDRKPPRTIAEIVVIAPREKTAVARVLTSVREIHTGATAGGGMEP
jgi:hypothetical protein